LNLIGKRLFIAWQEMKKKTTLTIFFDELVVFHYFRYFEISFYWIKCSFIFHVSQLITFSADLQAIYMGILLFFRFSISADDFRSIEGAFAGSGPIFPDERFMKFVWTKQWPAYWPQKLFEILCQTETSLSGTENVIKKCTIPRVHHAISNIYV
jgi:hypothetical protein